QLFALDWIGAQILEHQQAPHSWGCAQRGDFEAGNHCEGLLSLESRAAMRKNGCACIPRCKEIAPRMLTPTWGADVEVDVVGPQTDPIHGCQMTNGITLMSVQYEFWLGRGPRREVQQHGIGRLCRCLRCVSFLFLICIQV